MNIGDRISELLNQNGMNAKELAEKVGATPSTIYSLIQRGSSRIDVNLLIKIADVLHTSADAIIKGEDYSIDSRSARKGIRIPVLGRVAAGIPIEAIENIIDYEEIPEQLAKGGEFFGLQIKGDSMSPRIQEGDVVIVRKQEYAEDGYTVLTIEKWWIGDAYPSQNIVEEHTDDEPYESYTEAELWEDLKNCDEIQVDVDKYMEEILDKKIDGGDYTWIKIEIA